MLVSLVIAQVICMEKNMKLALIVFILSKSTNKIYPLLGVHELASCVSSDRLFYKTHLICRLQIADHVKVFSKGKITNKM